MQQGFSAPRRFSLLVCSLFCPLATSIPPSYSPISSCHAAAGAWTGAKKFQQRLLTIQKKKGSNINSYGFGKQTAAALDYWESSKWERQRNTGLVEETESCKVQSLVSFKCTGRFETGERAKGEKRGAGGREGASVWSGGGTLGTHTVRRRGAKAACLRSCQAPSTVVLKKPHCNCGCVHVSRRYPRPRTACSC